MFDTFCYAFNGVMPLTLLIILGYLLRRSGFGNDEFYLSLNRLCFRLFMPVQLFTNMLALEDLSQVNWNVILCAFIGFVLCFTVGMVVAHLFVHKRDQQGVIIQAAFRSNQAMIGLPLSQALGGVEAVAVASLISAIFVPLFNVLAVIVLTVYSGKKEKIQWKNLLCSILRNPLIIGISAGLAVALIRQSVPGAIELWQNCFGRFTVLEKVLGDLSKIASPLMLIAMGARVELKAMDKLLGKVVLGSFLRLIVSPIIGLGLTIILSPMLGLTSVELVGLVALFASPVAISSPVMVQEIGGDTQLASQLVVWSSIASMLTMFILAFLLRAGGFA
ncbi:MAG: AEC family transporter [Clostridiales bacterium]|nr:AEC family transporter [Clostridiales bacterium]